MVSGGTSLVALIGALLVLKPPALDLAELGLRPVKATPTIEQSRNPPGAVRDAVIVVLAGHDEPVRVRDIHSAVCALLGAPVPRSSVKGYLGSQAAAETGWMRRTSQGFYVLRTDLPDHLVTRARRRIKPRRG